MTNYRPTKRKQWLIFGQAAQVTICCEMARFTQAFEANIARGKLGESLIDQVALIDELIELVRRQDINKIWRRTFEILIIMHLHKKDII